MTANDKRTIEELLMRMVQSKQLSVKTRTDDDYYSLTQEGKANTEAILRQNEDAQLFLFSLFFKLNHRKMKRTDKYSTLKEAIDFVSKFNPDFLTVLRKACNEGKIKGLKLRHGM